MIYILLAGMIMIASNLNFNSVYHDEALNILMGRQVLAGKVCPGCAQNTGSVIIHPVLAAMGDSVAGIYGARSVSILFGLGLTFIVYQITNILIPGKNSLIAAMLFLFSGNTMYLSKLATYDIVAAFFLGLSFLLILLSEQKQSSYRTGFMLLGGAFFLVLAAASKYVVAVFIPVLIVYVLFKNRPFDALLFFLLPLLAFSFVYGSLALYPAGDVLFGSIGSVQKESQTPFPVLLNWTMRWVTMPYLLAVFGLFHKEKGRAVIPLILLSTPVLILHLATGTEQSVNKNVIFSLIFLAPAAALGIEHMASLFSSRIDTTWVRPFFTSAVLIVVLTFGINELKWLEKQYPDMRPVMAFFNENGFNGMLVTVDSDYGDAVYTYTLGSRFPQAQFLPFTEIKKAELSGNPVRKPDFVITDGFYSKKSLHDEVVNYLTDDYIIMKELTVPIAGGLQNINIFKKEAVS